VATSPDRAGRWQGEVVVDTRPLWRILLEHSYRPLLLLLGAAAFVVVYTMPTPAGLAPEGQKALAVFALCVVYWSTSVLPLMVTSIFAMVLLIVTGVLNAKDAYALFGNEAMFFILAAFILAACLMKCGLSTRIAIGILRRFGHTPRTLLLTLFLMNAFMAFFMSEHAVAAMTFPITVEIARVLRLNQARSNYARSLFLALAWGTSIGGIATLLGGARAPLAIAMLRETTGRSYGFAEWTLLSFPLVIILLVAGWILMRLFFPVDIVSVREADDAIAERALRMGRTTVREKWIGAVMVLTLIAWIVGGEEFGLATIGLAAIVVMFLFGLVTWDDVEGFVNWGILLMYGGAIALGAAVNKSGAAVWLAQKLVTDWADSPAAVVVLLGGASIILTEALSNSAVVALLMPVALGLAGPLGIDPALMAPIIALPAGLGFMLPVGTPANAIAYSSGFVRMRDMLIPGLLLDLAAWAGFSFLALYYWPLIGLPLSP
jgi:sodium-dependent dicarboxylate transporter 2/3/5